MSQSFEKLEAILARETFPLDFTYKVVGHSTEAFRLGAQALEQEFSALRVTGSRSSASGKHVSITYLLSAQTPEEIIAVYRRIQALPDVLWML